MSKPLLSTLAAFIFFHVAVTAQDTVWLSKTWETTTRDDAAFYHFKEKTDSGIWVTVYFLSGAIHHKALFDSHDTSHILIAQAYEYDNSAVLQKSFIYANGNINGPEVWYHDNGKELQKGDNRNGNREGLWTAYYPSGKLAGSVVYVSGAETNVQLYNEDGSKKEGNQYLVDGQFPGGQAQWMRFMSKSLHYPDYAVEHRIKGTVIVAFKTTKTGKVTEPRVLQSIEKHLDAEALRMIRESPDWEPARVAGQPVESYHKQPVLFNF